MKLIYWYAAIETDADCYSVRERTKREAKAKVAELSHHTFGPVTKVTVEYRDGFDLLQQCTGEGGIYNESRYG